MTDWRTAINRGSELASLVGAWRRDSSRFHELGQDNLAKLMAHMAHELELALKAQDEREVTISQASEISGYTQDWLRRMVKNGRIAGRRDGNRYFVQVSSLPRRIPKTRSVVDELAAIRRTNDVGRDAAGNP